LKTDVRYVRVINVATQCENEISGYHDLKMDLEPPMHQKLLC
jgi:hypothetical protein